MSDERLQQIEQKRCSECGHVLSAGEHADWCMTARDPGALRRERAVRQ